MAEDPGALRRWMVAGPHLAMVITEYESTIDNSVGTNQKHHGKSTPQQQAFADDVRSLVSIMDELANSFLDQTKELVTIDSQHVMPQNVVEHLEQIQSRLETKYRTFIEERFLKNETSNGH